MLLLVIYLSKSKIRHYIRTFAAAVVAGTVITTSTIATAFNDGLYLIKPAGNKLIYVNVGKHDGEQVLWLERCTNAHQKVFHLKATGAIEAVTITHHDVEKTGLCVEPAGNANGAVLRLLACKEKPDQLWNITPQGELRASNQMCVRDDPRSDRLVMWACMDTKFQWTLQRFLIE